MIDHCKGTNQDAAHRSGKSYKQVVNRDIIAQPGCQQIVLWMKQSLIG